MEPEAAWGPRWVNCVHPISLQYMEIATQKRSLVVLAADLPNVEEVVDLIAEVGQYITAVKTHVDAIEGFSKDSWESVVQEARKQGVLVFEDRKFADIGRVVQTQMGGLYNIRAWADIVTSHSISGPDVVDGIAAAWEAEERVGGVLLLAQMSSRENLLKDGYTKETLAIGRGSPHVMGFIGNGSSSKDVSALRELVGEERMIWTPGVSLSAAEGVLGQRYGNPSDAIRAGSDAIIVGSGIHGSSSPLEAAKEYAKASWEALLER